MSLLLHRPFALPLTLGLGLGLSLYTHSTLLQRPYRLDSGGASSLSSAGGANGKYSYTSSAKTPVVTRGGRLNPRAVRQISLGSVTGRFVFHGLVVWEVVLSGEGGGFGVGCREEKSGNGKITHGSYDNDS